MKRFQASLRPEQNQRRQYTMADLDFVTDLLLRLDERYGLEAYRSIRELAAVDSELREQLDASPGLIDELENALAGFAASIVVSG